MKPADFFSRIALAAKSYAGIPASVTMAQAAIESSWGESELCKMGNALFGIKVTPDWHGDVVVLPTHEDKPDGTRIIVPGRFRAYSSWYESVIDHAQFLRSNPRYAHALGITDPAAFAKAIAAAGYSTNPKYADLIMEIIKEHDL